ncbi:MAG: methyltransferase [Deltaproteobacteria bacterium HGW-Deltaproteobacteria-14]|jgi:caffeoyl-CoA O-methyltransferase|nr:MAG: methyltransferase [Deltaproteobacteria bacterium HGW-Deltaproteobacteria-14]
MKAIVDEEIEGYAADHSEVLSSVYWRLQEETFTSMSSPSMQVGRVEGRLLKLLVQIAGAKRAVEVGTFTGYSALCIAEGLPADGTLMCFDKDPVATAVARRYWAEAPWGNKIELHLGDARALVQQIEGRIDFAFIDADKSGYRLYWDVLVDKLRPGGLIVVDNVLWSGRVLAPEQEDDHAIVAFNRHAAADRRVEKVMLTVRDGILIARKR